MDVMGIKKPESLLTLASKKINDYFAYLTAYRS